MNQSTTKPEMTEAARKLHAGMQDGTHLPLTPENLESTLAAFPIRMDSITQVTASESGIVAAGIFDRVPAVTWVGIDGSAGYRLFGERPITIMKASRWATVRRRLSLAWAALTGRDDD